MIKNKVVLVTGGTGTFGQEFVKQALKLNPKAIRILSRGETLQADMKATFNDERLRFFIGDVRDRNRVYRATKGVDIVIHAAALKIVPTAEYNPIEAVRTNVEGSVNVIDTAIDCGVQKVIAISSDKACNPVNLYGATKLVMERLITQANVYGQTKFSCVRYGNVVGSRGSLACLLPQMVKDRLITITDDRMTRFWMTIEQGVNFVINSLKWMKGGEVFVPKIPSMRVPDLMDAVAPKVKREIIGIRPGEKLNETLITEDEARHTKECSTYYVVEPEFPFWLGDGVPQFKPLPKGFTYTSANNTHWLSPKEMRGMVCIPK